MFKMYSNVKLMDWLLTWSDHPRKGERLTYFWNKACEEFDKRAEHIELRTEYYHFERGGVEQRGLYTYTPECIIRTDAPKEYTAQDQWNDKVKLFMSTVADAMEAQGNKSYMRALIHGV